jgi:murein L,D-transpeptidase YcbB/YkuD
VQSDTRTIVVNIPSADLFVFEAGKRVFYSKVVLGKQSTPTHTVSSSMKYIILYPYWMVPKGIATKELLPQIKKDRAFLENNNFQVLNNSGKIVDPAMIDWSSLSRTFFPYQIRQSTGCDNSLGILKFDFYNPFSAYLHDTPEKYLFARKNRFYSHGCIRVERAMELAQFLLRENSIAVDTLVRNPCKLNEPPEYVLLKEPVNVFIVYSRAWPLENGELSFYDNIYHKPE